MSDLLITYILSKYSWDSHLYRVRSDEILLKTETTFESVISNKILVEIFLTAAMNQENRNIDQDSE